MIDLHSHLVPGVDDGAADLAESRAALSAMRDQGVTALVVTPHLDGSVTQRPERLAAELERLDQGWEQLRSLAAAEFTELRLERGVELLLDTPTPVLDDPRLRLAGTRAVLVEFSLAGGVPPAAGRVLFDLRMGGWQPVLAHPERYPTTSGSGLEAPEEWRRMGALLQVNWGSLAGRYGEGPQRIAWGLLERGWASLVSGDYHARGPFRAAEAREQLLARGGQEQLELLSVENPGRVLRGQSPLPVPPLPARASLWRRLLGRS